MPHKALVIYLQDHLAGSTAGVNLARRIAKSNEDTSVGRTLALVASEIEADREALIKLMQALRIPPSRVKNAGAWLAERAARLKPNGRMRGEANLQRLHELETLSLGIAGKLSLWESLRVAPEASAFAFLDLDELEERARSQRERVESERLSFARLAFAADSAVQHAPAAPSDAR